MTTSASVAAARYRATQIQSATPLERVVLLYDGALRHVDAAVEALGRRDVGARRVALSKAIAIVGELKSTLDMERGGEIAARLDGLYAFIQRRLLDGARQQQAGPLEDARRVLGTLRDAWRTVAADAQKIPA